MHNALSKSCILHDMGTFTEQEMQGKRLREAREAKFETATEAWNTIKRHVKVGLQTYIQHENGTRGYKAHAKDYAHALDVDASWLLWGTGEAEAEPAGIPILGQVSAGGETYTIWDYDPTVINERLPIFIRGAEMALPVRGDSMFPRYKEGEYVIAGAMSYDIERWIGRDVVAQVADGRIVLKELWRCPTGRWTLESINPMYRRIEDVNLDWVRPVLSNLILPN